MHSMIEEKDEYDPVNEARTALPNLHIKYKHNIPVNQQNLLGVVIDIKYLWKFLYEVQSICEVSPVQLLCMRHCFSGFIYNNTTGEEDINILVDFWKVSFVII